MNSEYQAGIISMEIGLPTLEEGRCEDRVKGSAGRAIRLRIPFKGSGFNSRIVIDSYNTLGLRCDKCHRGSRVTSIPNTVHLIPSLLASVFDRQGRKLWEEGLVWNGEDRGVRRHDIAEEGRAK